MAKPDYEEVIKQRNAAREELAAVQGERDDARKQVEELQVHIAELKASPPPLLLAAAPEDLGPETDPAMGDLTPDYVRWRFKTAAEVEFRAIYAGREQHLPDDVREALGLPAAEPQAE